MSTHNSIGQVLDEVLRSINIFRRRASPNLDKRNKKKTNESLCDLAANACPIQFDFSVGMKSIGNKRKLLPISYTF